MWILELVHHRDIVQLDIQVLIHALQRSADGDVIFQFDGDFVVDESFEEAEEQHGRGVFDSTAIEEVEASRRAMCRTCNDF